MIDEFRNLEEFWHAHLEEIECHKFARAYLSSLLSRPADLSKDSLTIVFAQAREKQDFEKFQGLADYLFFTESFFPESLSAASKEYYQSLAQMSYYSCFKLIDRKLFVYEYLADEFVRLTRQVRQIRKAICTHDRKSLISRI